MAECAAVRRGEEAWVKVCFFMRNIIISVGILNTSEYISDMEIIDSHEDHLDFRGQLKFEVPRYLWGNSLQKPSIYSRF